MQFDDSAHITPCEQVTEDALNLVTSVNELTVSLIL